MPAVVLTAYVYVAVAGNVLILVSVAVLRVTGPDVIVEGPGEPVIENFRRVDDKVYSGAQPDSAAFVDLAAMGVTLVVDLRTGHPGDPNLDDPDALGHLGIEYLSLPVRDGHAPRPDVVTRFVEAVEGNEGLVYMHCGGGVGRSGSLQAAYLNTRGLDFSVREQLAIGPPTIEQLFYVWRGDPHDPASNNSIVAALSRSVIDGPRTVLTWLKGVF